ncbi:MAG TPA: hypothetical protein VFN55_19115 [Solirubrobacteraceae bacterium]|nr:hypothetical protein [Solirubrobacteraceae bacterium]
MTWVETELGGFRARHDAEETRDARRVLQSLSVTELRMAELFPRPPGELTVVLHSSTASLTLSHPALPLIWLSTAPAARRYVAGWAGRDEIHVLSPKVLRGRASNVTGSREMLALSAASLYARRVIIANNRELQRVFGPVRMARGARWAWLIEGGARWFAGQTDHARPAIARRLREGGRPSFPPGYRDAALLGGTVFDLLAAERGERAAAALASRLAPGGPRAALIEAFGGRALDHTAGAWRAHLSRLAGAP